MLIWLVGHKPLPLALQRKGSSYWVRSLNQMCPANFCRSSRKRKPPDAFGKVPGHGSWSNLSHKCTKNLEIGGASLTNDAFWGKNRRAGLAPYYLHGLYTTGISPRGYPLLINRGRRAGHLCRHPWQIHDHRRSPTTNLMLAYACGG